MVWAVAAALGAKAYSEFDAYMEEGDATAEEVRAWADNPNHTPAPTLPVISSFWQRTPDGQWWYIAHNKITLWMLGQTYLPPQPSWIDAQGKTRTTWRPSYATAQLWPSQPGEFKLAMQQTATANWQHALDDGIPKYAMNPIPNGTPVKMPPEAVAIAKTLGAIPTAIGKGKVKPFSLPRAQSPSTSRAILAIGFAMSTLAVASYFLWKRG